MKKLAVIGGGPKAAALAAKAAALKCCGLSGFEVTVFEKTTDLMSHWIGGYGYSDGMRLLCTLPEKDVGFPYPDTTYLLELMGLTAPDVNKAMLAEFSWLAYQTTSNLWRKGYLEWIDRKRPAPTHIDWSSYLKWVLEKAVTLSSGSVRRELDREIAEIEFDERSGNWVLLSKEGTLLTNPVQHLAITGTGDPGVTPIEPTSYMSDPEKIGVFNGKNAWTDKNLRRLESFQTGLANPFLTDEFIGVLGGGGTGASIAAALIEFNSKAPIWMFTRKSTLLSRGKSYFETSLISDPEVGTLAWTEMTFADRQEFIDRVDRGVVSDQIMETLENGNLINTSIEFEKIEVTNRNKQFDDDDDFQLWVVGKQWYVDDLTFVKAQREVKIPVKLFIDARGFNGWWFVERLQHTTLKTCLSNKLVRQILERTIERDLSLKFNLSRMDFYNLAEDLLRDAKDEIEKAWQSYAAVPKQLQWEDSKIYVPMVSALAQGPGLPNLSCLGLMANRILLS